MLADLILVEEVLAWILTDLVSFVALLILIWISRDLWRSES